MPTGVFSYVCKYFLATSTPPSQAQHHFEVLDQDTVIANVNSEYMSEEKVLDGIQIIRERMMSVVSPSGVPFLKEKTREELRTLLDTTLILINKNDVTGTIYIEPLENNTVASIGGFVCETRGYGKQLLASALQRTWNLEYEHAISITASDKVKKIFEHYGSRSTNEQFNQYLEAARMRYSSEDLPELFTFTIPQE